MTKSVLATLLFTVACGSPSGGGDDTTPDGNTGGTTFYQDSDGDGFGDVTKTVMADVTPTGYVAKSGDCNDHDAAIHPGAPEVCDHVDNNCDGKIDDADPALDTASATTYFADTDGDGFGDPNQTVKACAQKPGYVADNTDCDDSDPAVHALTTFYRDADGDGFGAAATTTNACHQPFGWVADATDCNDGSSASHPGATEICDGADNDCNGGVDGTAASPNQCAALVGTYSGTYTHHTDERIGSTIINQVDCSGTGTVSLVLSRSPALQGSFACTYAGSLGGFSHNQHVTISASVDLAGHVIGTITHTYDDFGEQQRTYNITGTQTPSGISLSGTGSWYPDPMSAVPWGVTFSISGSK
jgi:hypothetical protein